MDFSGRAFPPICRLCWPKGRKRTGELSAVAEARLRHAAVGRVAQLRFRIPHRDQKLRERLHRHRQEAALEIDDSRGGHARQELANVGRGNYFGPGAPAGPRYHHYILELYALNKMLDVLADATRVQLLDAMKDIVVGKAAYVGRFRQ